MWEIVAFFRLFFDKMRLGILHSHRDGKYFNKLIISSDTFGAIGVKASGASGWINRNTNFKHSQWILFPVEISITSFT